MSIKFNINKLGAITNSTIEFKPLMIFSGDSNLGKSYAAFLSYYFINLFTGNRLQDFVDSKTPTKKLKFELENNNLASFELSIKKLQRWIKTDSKNFIGYLIGNSDFDADVDIEFGIDDLKIEFNIKDNIGIETDGKTLNPPKSIFVKVGEESYEAYLSFKDTIPELLRLVLERYFLKELFKKNYNYHTIFFPPSRAAFVGTNFSTMNEIMLSAGMYKEFLKDMELISSANEKTYNPSKKITELINDLIGGEIKNEKGLLFYEFDKQRIPIASAASSIKELSPLTLLLKRFRPKDFSVLFEEPEAHTHPTMQVKLANIIGQLVNQGAFFQITTHSDYFLNQINNSVRLFKIKEYDKAKFSSFCGDNNLNENNVLDPKLLGAYLLKKRQDGTVEIVTQDVSNGIPFDTFKETVNKLMSDSSSIEDRLEEIDNDD